MSLFKYPFTDRQGDIRQRLYAHTVRITNSMRIAENSKEEIEPLKTIDCNTLLKQTVRGEERTIERFVFVWAYPKSEKESKELYAMHKDQTFSVSEIPKELLVCIHDSVTHLTYFCVNQAFTKKGPKHSLEDNQWFVLPPSRAMAMVLRFHSAAIPKEYRGTANKACAWIVNSAREYDYLKYATLLASRKKAVLNIRENKDNEGTPEYEKLKQDCADIYNEFKEESEKLISLCINHDLMPLFPTYVLQESTAYKIDTSSCPEFQPKTGASPSSSRKKSSSAAETTVSSDTEKAKTSSKKRKQTKILSSEKLAISLGMHKNGKKGKALKTTNKKTVGDKEVKKSPKKTKKAETSPVASSSSATSAKTSSSSSKAKKTFSLIPIVKGMPCLKSLEKGPMEEMVTTTDEDDSCIDKEEKKSKVSAAATNSTDPKVWSDLRKWVASHSHLIKSSAEGCSDVRKQIPIETYCMEGLEPCKSKKKNAFSGNVSSAYKALGKLQAEQTEAELSPAEWIVANYQKHGDEATEVYLELTQEALFSGVPNDKVPKEKRQAVRDSRMMNSLISRSFGNQELIAHPVVETQQQLLWQAGPAVLEVQKRLDQEMWRRISEQSEEPLKMVIAAVDIAEKSDKQEKELHKTKQDLVESIEKSKKHLAEVATLKETLSVSESRVKELEQLLNTARIDLESEKKASAVLMSIAKIKEQKLEEASQKNKKEKTSVKRKKDDSENSSADKALSQASAAKNMFESESDTEQSFPKKKSRVTKKLSEKAQGKLEAKPSKQEEAEQEREIQEKQEAYEEMQYEDEDEQMNPESVENGDYNDPHSSDNASESSGEDEEMNLDFDI